MNSSCHWRFFETFEESGCFNDQASVHRKNESTLAKTRNEKIINRPETNCLGKKGKGLDNDLRELYR
jgi:hypothetical protein